MKTVGILTFQWFDNYGTALQAYGLQTAIAGLGHDVHIVPIFIRERRGLMSLVSKSLHGLCLKFRRYMVDHGDRRHTGFERFRRAHFNHGGLKPMCFQEVLRHAFDEDTLVFGSDNIWSPWCVSLQDPMGDVFFGDGIRHPRKVVYAASTAGLLSDHPDWREAVRRIRSAGFSAIALRERVNCELFVQSGMPDVLNVPDPAFLLTKDQWAVVEANPEDVGSRSYVFGYDLGHPGVISIRQGCEAVATAAAADVKIPYPKMFWADRDVACFPGPSEWLWMVHHADAVVTNSFHGVMFSIVYNRPFVFVPVRGEDKTLSMRTCEVLRSVGLEDRALADGGDVVETMNAPVDWNAVNRKVVALRQRGLAYLADTL